MNMLVFGAGVIGTIYAWQLSLAGHDVSLLVRPERKQHMESQGILISCLAEGARVVYEGHLAHAADEMRIMYGEVLQEGERFGVAMPHFREFQTYVERLDVVGSVGKEQTNEYTTGRF